MKKFSVVQMVVNLNINQNTCNYVVIDLLTSNFSHYSYHIFLICLMLVMEPSIVKSSLYPFPNKLFFLMCLHYKYLKTLWEKEKLLIMSNFSFSHCIFYSFGELFTIFIEFKIVIYKLFQFGRV